MPNNKPIHDIPLGRVKAAIWQNETENGKRYNVTFCRLYRVEDEWKSSDSYGRDDLLLLKKAADLAFNWIYEQGRE